VFVWREIFNLHNRAEKLFSNLLPPCFCGPIVAVAVVAVVVVGAAAAVLRVCKPIIVYAVCACYLFPQSASPLILLNIVPPKIKQVISHYLLKVPAELRVDECLRLGG